MNDEKNDDAIKRSNIVIYKLRRNIQSQDVHAEITGGEFFHRKKKKIEEYCLSKFFNH